MSDDKELNFGHTVLMLLSGMYSDLDMSSEPDRDMIMDEIVSSYSKGMTVEATVAYLIKKFNFVHIGARQ